MDETPNADQQNSENESQKQAQYSPPAGQVSEPKNLTPEESRQELREAIKGSNEVLVTATTALSLFPDTVTLDRAKLTVTRRTFFSSAEVMSIRVEDILNATAMFGPFLGSFKIATRVMSTETPYTVGHFWRKDAEKLKRITQGYIIALQREIDCNGLNTKELAKLLDQLGEDVH